MAGDQKKFRAEGRTLVMLDESGFMLQPVRRRTWAPRGKTPTIVPCAKHDRWSVLGALTVAPHRRRLGLYFRGWDENVRSEHLRAFVVDLQRQLRRPLLVVWDRLAAHRKVARELGDDPRFAFEFLPPYAPQLNPQEWVWAHTKYGALANFCAQSFAHLGERLKKTLRHTRRCPAILEGFFRGADLPLD